MNKLEVKLVLRTTEGDPLDSDTSTTVGLLLAIPGLFFAFVIPPLLLDLLPVLLSALFLLLLSVLFLLLLLVLVRLFFLNGVVEVAACAIGVVGAGIAAKGKFCTVTLALSELIIIA